MVKPDFVIQLGDFKFDKLEVPERIAFGGDQALVVHKLPGGVRVIDAMGRDDAPIHWEGIFTGQGARERARYIDALRIAGKRLTLSWDQLRYTVIIEHFYADFARFYELPYEISLVVVQDLASPSAEGGAASLDDMMKADAGDALTRGGLIGSDTLNSALGGIHDAVSSVQSFVNATRAEINTVLQPLLATQQQVRELIDAASPLLDDAIALGNVVPGLEFGTAAVKLQEQVDGFGQISNLYQLQSTLGRMSSNLTADGQAGRLVDVAGGDLYHMAAQNYGDASAWTTIARANALTDPVIPDVRQLTIPQIPDGADGVLAA